ncbi:uncharacterized protein DFL_005865 [Arthrobotrys flagrans]|uniref:Nucleolar pre-ribosomal-associated protein 1 N-terminal domain-containing protein n=1 Tax=Arthrobotrys flagrans TaxID=97331 RepID=A0A436ZYJ8_ARTFL|nr:hypothetical protein DFL_005865 [Arthrobotrys flagrans]
MAKRPFNQADVEGQDRRPGNTPKRQKKDDSAPSKGLALEDITSARQVQGLFADYSNAGKIQAGIQSFKKFLAECRDLQYALHLNEEIKLCILQEYLESQISKDGDETCGDLMQAWSFASQSNNFQLLSSVPTILHLLLRTISLFPTWKKHGIALIKSTLQPPYLKLIYRSLSGSKDAISSPSLRLLTEINKFDNGSLCSLLHQSLDFTVKDLTRNLEIKKTERLDRVPVEDPDRPSVRTVFVRFILSFFRYGAHNIKTDIMGLRAFTTPLFKYIRQDTAAVIDEVLTAFRDHIMADQDISRSSKTNYFNDWSLGRLAELCYRDDPIDPENPDRAVADAVFEFLGGVCTTPGNGVCFKDNGWYNGSKSDASEKTGKQQVNNRILLGLLKSLRPYSNTYHLRLLIAVFTAAPELPAAYFNENTAFTFDPKLTATWIGLSSVLLETIQIPVPEGFGYSGGDGVPSAPPPVRNSVENILPQQLNRAVLTKCLGFNNNFVRFVAVRILNAAFAKLAAVLDGMGRMAEELVDGSVWAKGVYDLVDEFSKKVPEVGVVVSVFNQMKEDAGLQREAGSRLLRNYYEYLPSIVGAVSTGSGGRGGFDFGPAFGRVLVKIGESKGFEALEVKHCLHLAKLLPETRWWAKPTAAKYSPAVTLMKVFKEGNGGEQTGDVYKLLEKIVDDSPVFGKSGSGRNGVHPLEALMESFECVKEKEGWERVLGYLDNACGRLVQGPYKYFDIVGEALERIKGKRGLSPLLAALFHQFNFLKKEEEKKEELEGLCRWLLSVANNFWVIGEIPMVRKDGVDIASVEGGGPSEIFAQFVEGVKAWRRCLEDFKLGKVGSFADLVGFPLEVELPESKALSKSRNLKDIREKYGHFYTLAEALTARPTVVTFYYWKWIQHVVEILLKATLNIDESLLDEPDFSALEGIHNNVLDAYENAARKVLKNDSYDTDSRSKRCLDFMVDTAGKPLYLEYFAATDRRLMGRFDIALINIYSLLPVGSLQDGGIKPHLFRKLSQIPSASYSADPKQVTKLSTFLKLLLDVADLKKCCRDANAVELPDLAWKVIFERLSASRETLVGEEVWGAISGGNDISEHPWVPLVKLVKEQDSAGLLNISVGFETLNEIIVEKSARAFSTFLLLLLQKGGFVKGVEGLLDTIAKYLETTSKEQLTNITFPICKTIKDFAMERDDSTGRLRWKKRDLKHGDDMQLDEDWKERFIQLFYLDNYPGTSTPLHQALLESYKSLGSGGCTAEYFEIGLDFGLITWSEQVLDLLQLDDKNNNFLSTSTFPLFEAAYRLSQGSDMTWFHIKLQKMVYTLTVELSKPKISEEDDGSLLEGLENLGAFMGRNEVDLLDYVAKDAVDSLLEVLFEKLGVGRGVVAFAAGVMAGIEDVKYLQHSKLLQLILTTPTSLSSSPRNSNKKEETYHLSYILRKLFYASKAQHSNITTLDCVISIYSGTNDVVDSILLGILISIEGFMQRSILERISSVTITDDEGKKFVERDGKGQLKVFISTKVAGKSMNHFARRKVEFKGTGNTEDLKGFLEKCKRADEEDEADVRGKTYDVGFIAGLVMNGLTTEKEEQKLDVKDIIEKGLLGYILLSLSSETGEERGMGEAVLTAIVRRLEGAVGGGRGYKERIEVMHLICKILAGIAVFNEEENGGLKEWGIPTVTALLLAKMVGIVSNPGHFLYEKVMVWLQSRATVDLKEIPMLREFLRSEGEGYWKEVGWIIEGLAGGVKGVVDIEVFRKRGVFEEVLGVYGALIPTTASGKGKEEGIRKKILEILWNTAGVEGGATTLVTRTGVVSWIKMMICVVEGEGERVVLKRLAARLWEGCDRGYVKQWSEGNIGRVLEGLVGL